jgi:post-segregation antitoxin (ccd killing protein)
LDTARGSERTVAHVDGRPVGAGEVARLAREAELTPREALDRLVTREVLAAEAERRGLDRSAPLRTALERATRRAAVQAWLAAEVEATSPPPVVDEAAIDAAYVRQRARFVVPEKRASVHVLVPLDPRDGPERAEAARRLAARALAALRVGEPTAVVARFAADPEALGGGFRVRAEAVPPLAREDAADPAYTRALFDVPGPGVLPAPVRSSFGWHAVAVTSVEPESIAPREEVRATLQRELTTVARRTKLEALLAAAERHHPTRYADDVDARLLALDPHLEAAP